MMLPKSTRLIYGRILLIHLSDCLFTYVLVYSFITLFIQQVELRAKPMEAIKHLALHSPYSQ